MKAFFPGDALLQKTLELNGFVGKVEIFLTQLALESAFGKDELAVKHNNYGGIKWGVAKNGAPAEPTVKWFADYGTGVMRSSRDSIYAYIKFPNLERFILCYVRFLSQKRYTSRGIKNATSIESFGQILQDAGYAKDKGYKVALVKTFNSQYGPSLEGDDQGIFPNVDQLMFPELSFIRSDILKSTRSFSFMKDMENKFKIMFGDDDLF